MKIIICKCDRCCEITHETDLQRLKIEFNKVRIPDIAVRLPDIITGDLCPTCAHSFSETFFNAIQAWNADRKLPALDEIRKIEPL